MKRVEFWSSLECGASLTGLVRELDALGWRAEQRFLRRPQTSRGTRGRLLTALRCLRSDLRGALALHRAARAPRQSSILVVCTDNFYAPAVMMHAARKRGVPVVHWALDLYPHFLVQLGHVRAGGTADAWMGEFTHYSLRHAARNVFSCADIRHQAEERFGRIDHATVIPVGADGALFSSPPSSGVSEPIVIHYGANLGAADDVATIANLIATDGLHGLRFEFSGPADGRAAPITLVTLTDRARALRTPSQMYEAMVAGQAILAIAPEDSDLAETIRNHDAGWVVAPGDVNALRSLLRHLAAHPGEIPVKRQNAHRAGQMFFDQKILARQWSEVFDQLLPSDELPAMAPRRWSDPGARHPAAAIGSAAAFAGK